MPTPVAVEVAPAPPPADDPREQAPPQVPTPPALPAPERALELPAVEPSVAELSVAGLPAVGQAAVEQAAVGQAAVGQAAPGQPVVEAVDGTAGVADTPALTAAAGPAGDRTPARPKAITHREMPAVASPRDAEARSARARAATARRRPARSAEEETALLRAIFHPAPAELATSLTRIPGPRTGVDPVFAPMSHRRPRPPRSLSVALPTLVVLAFAAAFFAWTSAMPIWLAVGHGRAGTATVTACPVHGIPRSCATFMAADHSYSAWVTLLGPGTERAVTGQTVTAEMTSATSSVAYAGSRDDVYLRLGAGLGALLACGAGIVWATGALRLGGRRARTIALAGSFGGPLLLLLGMLTATF